MSSTILEVMRAPQEEVERLERSIVKELQTQPPRTHRVRAMIERIMAATNELVTDYEDTDGTRKDEIAALGTNHHNDNSNVLFAAFYDRLKEIRGNYHRCCPPAPARFPVDDDDDDDDVYNYQREPGMKFSGEEASGRYLDLHELFQLYVNSKFGERIHYCAYVDVFSRPHETIPLQLRLSSGGQYKQYLQKLLAYLIHFLKLTEPLQDVDRIFSMVATEFEQQWAANLNQVIIDLDEFTTAEELATKVRPEKLKETLASLGLKMGGTHQQRAERLHFFRKQQPTSRRHDHQREVAKEIALMEAKLKRLSALLHETIVRTKERAERKHGLTSKDLQAEGEEQCAYDESSDDHEPQQQNNNSNPLKLPMGWDGKPIPYWLYKLHGLGHEFKCEICGDYSYRGRKAYEQHFKEWRHQQGMQCLGIPNTNNFNEITSIEKAKELWERIQQRQRLNKWQPDLEEEFEDQEGNIYNKKTFTDLQRQGLI